MSGSPGLVDFAIQLVFLERVIVNCLVQCAKKVMSDSPELLDFAIELVFFVLNLPTGLALSFGEIQIKGGS